MLPLTSGRRHFDFLYTGTSVLLVSSQQFWGKSSRTRNAGAPHAKPILAARELRNFVLSPSITCLSDWLSPSAIGLLVSMSTETYFLVPLIKCALDEMINIPLR